MEQIFLLIGYNSRQLPTRVSTLESGELLWSNQEEVVIGKLIGKFSSYDKAYKQMQEEMEEDRLPELGFEIKQLLVKNSNY